MLASPLSGQRLVSDWWNAQGSGEDPEGAPSLRLHDLLQTRPPPADWHARCPTRTRDSVYSVCIKGTANAMLKHSRFTWMYYCFNINCNVHEIAFVKHDLGVNKLNFQGYCSRRCIQVELENTHLSMHWCIVKMISHFCIWKGIWSAKFSRY